MDYTHVIFDMDGLILGRYTLFSRYFNKFLFFVSIFKYLLVVQFFVVLWSGSEVV